VSGSSGSKESTAVVTTGPYSSYPSSFSAVGDWTLKQQCCFTVIVCVSDNSDIIFPLTELRFRKYTRVSTCIFFNVNLIIYCGV
jgi:hypothetical protein